MGNDKVLMRCDRAQARWQGMAEGLWGHEAAAWLGYG